MILGQYSPSLVPIAGSLIGIFSIISCYYIAIYLGHEKPLPHTWISTCANHYPQFLIFRFGTITNGVFLILSYFFNHFYIITIAAENSFHIKKYQPKITLLFGTLGIFALFVNTATIDTGKMNEHLHVLCAGSFFLFTTIACIYNTFIYWILFLKIKSINFWSLLFKTAFIMAMIFQVYLNQESFLSYDEFLSSDLAHYIQFTFAFTILGYFLIMGYDLKGYKMIYRKNI